MWDYLSATAVTADYTATELDIRPQNVQTEKIRKNQIVHYGDDESDEVITLSDSALFNVTFSLEMMTEADVGTIIDFYTDSAKANARGSTFYWVNYGEVADRHTYTVRFDMELDKAVKTAMQYSVAGIKLKVYGRKP